MVKIVHGSHFAKSVRMLPESIKTKLSKLLVILERDPFHPLLHTKNLSGQIAGFMSFRITRDWRGIFRFLEPDSIQLIEAAHRRGIYKK